ncbi:hypothetical protein [Pseudomonas sp. MWU13-2100]|uniref:hypothetical protein n=1 Tax=Pseudomonas sp. MWU13-2100 TaxID=2935075 RepID=UPI00200BFF55|nr:hypothetical protein [Pseudomonas sp. MWU13-2100]
MIHPATAAPRFFCLAFGWLALLEDECSSDLVAHLNRRKYYHDTQAGNACKTTKNGETRGNKKAAQGGLFTGFCKSQRTLAKPDTKTPDD